MDKTLENLLNKDNCFFIHYASDGFYNEAFSAPRVSCIVIFNDKTKEKGKFCIADYIQENSVEESEKLLFLKFKKFLEERPNVSFIHWNMNSQGFGFNAIQARAKEFCIEIPMIPKENLFDLSSYVEYLGGKKLSIKQVLWFNYFLDECFLDGKTEAEYFKKEKFDDILASVHSKVVGLSCIVEEIKKDSLITEKSSATQHDLTKEDKRKLALEIANSRKQMLDDIVNHNNRVLQNSYSEEEIDVDEKGLFFFDFAHPILSIFANWFGNKK